MRKKIRWSQDRAGSSPAARILVTFRDENDMANGVPSFFRKCTNPRAVAQRLSMMMDECGFEDHRVHEVFQAIQSDRCSEDAVRLICDRFLQDYAVLRSYVGGSAQNRDQWNVFLDEAVHYIRQVSGGRVKWKLAVAL
ncbi:MAG: hypothetical protein QM754_06325 [Tepidisphaeraceae bacterium]